MPSWSATTLAAPDCTIAVESGIIAAITPARLQALVRQYLADAAAVEVTVLPEGIDPPR